MKLQAIRLMEFLVTPLTKVITKQNSLYCKHALSWVSCFPVKGVYWTRNRRRHCSRLWFTRLYWRWVLEDRGFINEENFTTLGAKVHIPAFKGRSDQLTGQEMERSRIIANERIHVERVIGKMKKNYGFARTC